MKWGRFSLHPGNAGSKKYFIYESFIPVRKTSRLNFSTYLIIKHWLLCSTFLTKKQHFKSSKSEKLTLLHNKFWVAAFLIRNTCSKTLCFRFYNNLWKVSVNLSYYRFHFHSREKVIQCHMCNKIFIYLTFNYSISKGSFIDFCQQG